MNASQERDAILARQLDIQKDKVGLLFLDCCEGLFAGFCGEHLVAVFSQDFSEEPADFRLIIDHQDFVGRNFHGGFIRTICFSGAA